MIAYNLSFTEIAQEDLKVANEFYERQNSGLGEYFLDSILVDLESLKYYAGIHEKYFSFYKMLAKHFPFTIYYDIEDTMVTIHAILDSRQNPSSIKKRLS